MKKKILLVQYLIQVFQKMQLVHLIHVKKEDWRNASFVNCIVYTHEGLFGDGKGLTEQVFSTENLMNKLQNLYGVGQYFYYHNTEMVKTEHFYEPDPSVPLILGVVYWKDPDDYQEKLGMPVVIHQLVKPILVMRLLSTYFFGKTKDANKSISNILQTKCPKNIYVQLHDLEMRVLSISH